MNERESMQARAETAASSKANLNLRNAIERAKRQDGHGLTPSETLTLAIAAEKYLHIRDGAANDAAPHAPND